MYTIAAYIIYLFCSVVTVFAVGKNLHRNGKVYLFGECADEALSVSANNFLFIGYCLLNTAFALFFLRTTSKLVSITQVAEFIAGSQGVIFLSLGILHLVNIIFAPKIILYFLSKKLTHKNK